MELPKEVFIDDLIFLAYRGSVAHNMYVPNSDPNSIDDVDLMGVFIAPTSHYIGLNKSDRTIEEKIEVKDMLYDCVYYEISQLISTLPGSNDTTLNNAMVESRLIHVRALLDFFQKSGRKRQGGRILIINYSVPMGLTKQNNWRKDEVCILRIWDIFQIVNN